MTLIRTPQKIERFRTIQQQTFVQFPSDLKHENLKVVGYCQGDKIDRLKNLTIFHFDSLEFITKSTNVKKGSDFIHAKGHRKKEGSFKVLFLKRKK